MTSKTWGLILMLVAFVLGPLQVLAADVNLLNQLTLYGDVEGFNGPYRQSQTLWGQEFQSLLDIPQGSQVSVEAGVFADNQEQQNNQFTVFPILSFHYQTQTTQLIFGNLENENRYGYIEPLEDPLLELTRPVEYGLQWKEKADGFDSNWFLDWQILNTANQPEVFDYGGVTKADVNEHLSLEIQFHGYHEGGRIYFVRVINNYAPAIGLRLHGFLPALGQSSLAVFGLMSCDFEGQYITGPDWGDGLYARAGVAPAGLCEIYAILWNAQSFFSAEGDPNYNSQGLNNYYQANRTYEELGLKKTIADASGFLLDAEIKSEWADSTWALSGKLVATVPLNVAVPLEGSKSKDGSGDANP